MQVNVKMSSSARKVLLELASGCKDGGSHRTGVHRHDVERQVNARDAMGVANLARYLDRLQSPPRWLAGRESGAGFAEMVDAVLKARSPVSA